MKKEKVLYAVSVEDIINVSNEINIPFVEKDLYFIEDKIGDFFGSQWYESIIFALRELKK